MFEDSLLIIKPDYLHKRRPLLLKLLSCGFQIQGNRLLNFSPEQAAEFFADYAEEKGFMLEVILLSKGISEAFIVTKENGVHDLLSIMICYFGSTSELERNIHVTKHFDSVAREIIFIFPNYIHEPIPLFDSPNFCNRPMLKPLISHLYDIMQNVDCSQEDWKRRVARYLIETNSAVPTITNQCQITPACDLQEKAQQTTMTYKSTAKDAKPKMSSSITTSLLSSSTPHSSMLLSSSSCVTCGGFDHTEPCISELDLQKRVEPQSDEPICVDEEIIWKEVIVYEEEIPEEESEGRKSEPEPVEEMEGFGDEGSELEIMAQGDEGATVAEAESAVGAAPVPAAEPAPAPAAEEPAPPSPPPPAEEPPAEAPAE